MILPLWLSYVLFSSVHEVAKNFAGKCTDFCFFPDATTACPYFLLQLIIETLSESHYSRSACRVESVLIFKARVFPWGSSGALQQAAMIALFSFTSAM